MGGDREGEREGGCVCVCMRIHLRAWVRMRMPVCAHASFRSTVVNWERPGANEGNQEKDGGRAQAGRKERVGIDKVLGKGGGENAAESSL